MRGTVTTGRCAEDGRIPPRTRRRWASVGPSEESPEFQGQDEKDEARASEGQEERSASEVIDGGYSDRRGRLGEPEDSMHRLTLHLDVSGVTSREPSSRHTSRVGMAKKVLYINGLPSISTACRWGEAKSVEHIGR